MQMVINITEELYNLLPSVKNGGSLANSVILRAVKNGTPLPKGHGRLIDMKNLQKLVSRLTEHEAVQLILADREDYIPTIVEADKEERKE